MPKIRYFAKSKKKKKQNLNYKILYFITIKILFFKIIFKKSVRNLSQKGLNFWYRF